MLETMLDLSYAFIFVAGAAGVAAFTTLMAKSFTVVHAPLPSLTGSDKLGAMGAVATPRHETRKAITSLIEVVKRQQRSGLEAHIAGLNVDERKYREHGRAAQGNKPTSQECTNPRSTSSYL